MAHKSIGMPMYNGKKISYNNYIKTVGEIFMRLVEAVQKRVYDLAAENDYTLYRLCKVCAVPQPTILTMTLSNTVKLSTIYAICEGLNISLKDFFDSPRFDKESMMN
ncbi:MAG: hypothetical protein HFE47_06120 [Clostridia bacterium]|nr:hypothetical protein [Clostridia bacterium]